MIGALDLHDNIWFVASLWIGLTFIASIISIKLRISVALIEIFLGIIAANFLGIHETTDWINFLALVGSCLITFLAGVEVDPETLRNHWKPSLAIGGFSFLIPFLAVWLFAQFAMGWARPQAQIAGVALSTASVAVVYAVMIQTEHNKYSFGKMILSACFVNDFLTMVALTLLFAHPDGWMLAFTVVLIGALWAIPRVTAFIIDKLGASHESSEPEVKFVLLMLFLLGGLATSANSEAVLPAYLVGVVLAGVFARDRTLVNRIRSTTFALFTPFYFIKAGLLVSLPAVWGALGIIVILFSLKIGTKYFGAYPFSRIYGSDTKQSHYIALLMGTGLTFGTIVSTVGLDHHIINQDQYTVLVIVVILSAVIPTIVAQRYFTPSIHSMKQWKSNQSRER